MPAPKKKATTPKKGYPTSQYAGITTVYKPNMTISSWEGDRGPEEHIKAMKQRAKRLSEGKKDVASAKRGDKSYSAKSVSRKQDVSTAKRLKAPRLSSDQIDYRKRITKSATSSAKNPGTEALLKNKPGRDSTEYNRAYIQAKKDIAAFKRGQAKKKK